MADPRCANSRYESPAKITENKRIISHLRGAGGRAP
jgi:hypothetical protein